MSGVPSHEDILDCDFGQAFNRGATMRVMGLPIDAVILESEDKEEWLKGWRYEDGICLDKGQPVLWTLAIGQAS